MRSAAERTENIRVPSAYEMTYRDLVECIDLAMSKQYFKAISIAFKLGFLRGVSAARNGKVEKNLGK